MWNAIRYAIRHLNKKLLDIQDEARTNHLAIIAIYKSLSPSQQEIVKDGLRIASLEKNRVKNKY